MTQKVLSTNTTTKGEFRITTQNLTKIAILSAISFALTKLPIPIPIPIFPPFLKMEISDIPPIIGALAISPIAGIFIALIKNLIDLIVNPVGLGIGQLANFILSCALFLPIWFIYSRKKTLTSFVIGSILGVLALVIIACLANYFILIPVYVMVLTTEESVVTVDTFVNMTRAVNPLVTDFRTLILFAIAPFNLIRGILVTIGGYFLFRALKRVPHLNL